MSCETDVAKVNLKSTVHSFAFFDREHGAITVEFIHDERGKPSRIVMRVAGDGGGREFAADNSTAKYKPCVAHCKDFARLQLTREKRTNKPSRRKARNAAK